MALQNQQGMYQSVPALNPLPYVNIALQARARKQAREDALDKYYNQLPDTINDKNIRDVEVPIIEDLKKELFEYGIKNREALKKGDGAAKLGLDQLFRKVQTVARLSQNAAKVDLTAGKSLMNKDNQFILNSDEYVADHELHNLPVTDPNHKTLDLTKHAANRPFNSDALIKRNADIKYSDSEPEVSDHPTDPLSQVVTTRPVLDEANKKVLFDRAANDLNNNPMFANYIKNKLDKGQLDGIVKIAQEQFGLKNPSDITDEHIAAAYEYSLLPVKQTVQKRIANTGAVMDKRAKMANAEWDRRTAIQQRNSLIRIAANKQGQEITNGTSGNSFDEFGGVTPIYIEIPNEGGFGSVEGKIDKGIVFDKDGNLFSGEIEVGKKDIPVNVSTSLTAGKIQIPNKVPLVVKEGIIVGIKTPNGVVDREKGILNLQKKANTEPIKAEQPTYGKPKGSGKAPVSKPEDKTNKWEKYKTN